MTIDYLNSPGLIPGHKGAISLKKALNRGLCSLYMTIGSLNSRGLIPGHRGALPQQGALRSGSDDGQLPEVVHPIKLRVQTTVRVR